MATTHKKDCMMLSISEHPHCTCGIEIDKPQKQSDFLTLRLLEEKRKADQLQTENNELNADLDLHDIIVSTYKAEVLYLKKLLETAICPNTVHGCQKATVTNSHGEPEPCQWCKMVMQVLRENKTK